jgi:hypothetical protein
VLGKVIGKVFGEAGRSESGLWEIEIRELMTLSGFETLKKPVSHPRAPWTFVLLRVLLPLQQPLKLGHSAVEQEKLSLVDKFFEPLQTPRTTVF